MVKMKKICWVVLAYFLFTSIILLQFVCLNIYKQLQITSSLKPLHHVFGKFHMEHDQTPGFENCKIGSGQESKMATITKNSKNNKTSPEPLAIFG